MKTQSHHELITKNNQHLNLSIIDKPHPQPITALVLIDFFDSDPQYNNETGNLKLIYSNIKDDDYAYLSLKLKRLTTSFSANNLLT